MSIYRGYEIKAHQDGGFYWTDGFVTCGRHENTFKTEEAAMDDIDAFKRNSRASA